MEIDGYLYNAYYNIILLYDITCASSTDQIRTCIRVFFDLGRHGELLSLNAPARNFKKITRIICIILYYIYMK